MKKRIKIVLSLILTLIVVVIVYIILVIKGIFPNPFLDTKDLVCRVDNFYSYDEIDLVMTFRFDKNALIKSYTEAYVYVIEDKEKLKQEQEDLISRNKNFNINGNEITIYTDFYIEKDMAYYGKTKNQVKQFCTEELFYDCK